MKALHIHDVHLAHQCARCTRSYPSMYRHSDGLVYCSPGDECRAEPPRRTKVVAVQEAGAKAGAKPKSAPKKTAAKKAVAKKATRPRRRSRT